MSSEISSNAYNQLINGAEITTLDSYDAKCEDKCDHKQQESSCESDEKKLDSSWAFKKADIFKESDKFYAECQAYEKKLYNKCTDKSTTESECEDEFYSEYKNKVFDLHRDIAYKCVDSKTKIENNGDIEKFCDYAGNFSKSLPHDKKGFVDKKEYKKLLDFCKGDISKLNEIKLGAERKLMNPSCIYGIDLMGIPKESFWIPASPSISSKAGAADLIEIYAMALARDIPFHQWKCSETIQWIIKALNKLSEFRGPKKCGKVTLDTLFRGETKGDLIGPFVSQFLYQTVPFGVQKCEQKVFAYVEGKDYLICYKDCKSMQNGYNPKEKNEQYHYSRYITTLRDGASYIHNDYPGQAGLMGAQILLGLGVPITCQHKDVNEHYFIELAHCDIFDLIHKASKLAMAAAWHHKWTQLKLRPEAYGLLVHEAKENGCNPYKLSKELLNSSILDKVKAKWGSYCLPQAYSEGSPTHPSYPSGHATWAGAVVTILKAFFDNDYEIEAFEPSCDGSYLVPLGYKVKVGDELDKLASNLGTFRNVGGIHYRSDMLGIYLGEAVAIELLEEAVQRYAFPVKFEFRARNGKKVVINNYNHFKKDDC